MSIVSSLAGTGRAYVVLQGRISDGQLKIQGAGPNVNRGYGISIVVPVPSDLAQWMKGLTASIPSLAASNQRYFAMQAAELDFDAGKVRVQVAGSKLNRKYGAVFSVTNDELASFVEQSLVEHEEDCEECEEEEAVVELI